MASLHCHILVSRPCCIDFDLTTRGNFRGFADFNMPQPFMPRVKNALDAEPRSVRLSHLVGAGGLWYGFGRMVTRL
jgi:hypothetical protein